MNIPLRFQQLSPRVRLYAAILAVLLVYLLFDQVHAVLLPADTWFVRGLEAIQDGRYYPDAERCFTRARAKETRADIAQTAWYVLRWHESHDDPQGQTRFYYLAGLEKLLGWTAVREQAWRARLEIRAAEDVQHVAWPAGSELNCGVAATLFDHFELTNPTDVRAVLAALLAERQGDYANAWQQLSSFAMHSPTIFRAFWQYDPFLLRDCAQAALHSGHPADARRWLALYRQQPPFRYNVYGDYQPSRRCVPANDHDEL